MHGDFSRGHQPDAKRGQSYTRGFAQQRRLLLDSDLNAMTDAIHERLRALARHTGCPKGSPNLGYLVTPGRLLALFRDLEGVVTASNNITLLRDYSHKYLDRFPSLHLRADQGTAGSATLRLRHTANGETVFWCRAEAATVVTLSGGVALNVPAGADLQPVTINLAAVQNLQIDLNTGEAIWIGLIESRQTATLAPRFDFAAGDYYLDGLPLANTADATWASNAVPPLAPNNFQVDNPTRNLAANDRLLVYLEGAEHHVTSVEDPGILEHALGGDTDTTTRGRAVGQVKLAWVPPAFDLEAFSRALDNPVLSSGTLNVTTPLAPPNPDPCALPVQGGYTGSDNRLYRFEVHTGDPLGTAVLKWSRDNGAELFLVVGATDQALTFPASTLLQPGDLVEVLTEETIALGDAGPATLDDALNSFTPPVRAVGRLVRLQAGPSSGTGVTFTMREPDGVAVVTLAAHFGPFPNNALKVRRWHGLIETTAAPTPNVHAVENGIEVELNSVFLPGDYWQYEARANDRDNANGPFQTTPHGPERDFAPLALMQFTADNQPLLLQRWLDDRFPPLCGLTADDIAFDGDRIGSDSDTVQEIIEELWERSGGGCCGFTLTATEGDPASAIIEILQTTQGEVTICLEPGVYALTTVIEIADRKVGLKGCPRAVLVASGVNPMFNITAGGRLALEELVLFGREVDGARVLVDMTATSEAFEARGVGFFAVPATTTVAVRVNAQEPLPFNPLQPVPLTLDDVNLQGPTIRLDRCMAAATWGISATALGALEVTSSFFSCADGCIWAERLLSTRARDTDLSAGVSLAALQAWTPETILANADAVAEQLVGVNSAGSPPTASVCIRTRRLALGSVDECRLSAGVGIAATRTNIVNLRGNFYRVSHTGVHIVAAGTTILDGERLDVIDKTGAFGVQLLLTGGFSMTDCFVANFGVGVALGAESAGWYPRTFQDVQMQNNQIDSVNVGIQIGTANGSSYPGDLNSVLLTENSITANAVGILINANATVPGGSGAGQTPQFTRVRVADNIVTARIGIGVMGHSIEVSDNRLCLFSGSGSRFGIMALNSVNLVCESNHIDLRAASGRGALSFAAALSAQAAAEAGMLGSYIVAAKVPSAAIEILGGSGARVAENAVQAEGAVTLRGLAAENHAQLAVKGNEFLSGPAECSRVNDVVFLANTVSGRVTIGNSTGGMVCDNRLRQHAGTDFDGSLSITNVLGGWKVADNRANGTIRIRPGLRRRFVFDWGDIFTAGIGMRASSVGGLSAIAELARDERFSSIVFAPVGGESPTMTVASGSPVPGTVALAVANPAWEINYVTGITDFVLGGARDVIGVIDDFPVVVIGFFTEDAYQIQCSANWARNIEIGNLGGGAIGNVQSTVQAIGNRAEEGIAVLPYQHLIVALNMARQYPFAGTATAQAILNPNLLI